jgi:outer membrane protein assembly factor BamB
LDIRWWPAGVGLGLAIGVVGVVQLQGDWPYQQRNLGTIVTLLIAGVWLWGWWLWGSRAPRRWRYGGAGGVAVAVLLGLSLFRIRGVSGDLLPILEWRWARPAAGATEVTLDPRVGEPTQPSAETAARPDFPQFFGPNRDGVVHGPALDPDWATRPPEVVWRRPIGAGWSGFAVVGDVAVTQEQDGENELVTAYELTTGRRLWAHADPARYRTTIAGEGPRATPTVVGDRVFTLGAQGRLNCLTLAEGRVVWARQVTEDAGSDVPEWGYAGSPLHRDGRLMVSGGGREDRSLLAYDAATGEILWTGGSAPAGYSSPVAVELAGVPQVLSFNSRRLSAHAPDTGVVLWEYPWGVGHPHVALPVVVGTNQVVVSSGYGVGAALLEVGRDADGGWAASRVWRSIRLKAKFANFSARGGFLYGLDDGVLACVALADGSSRWKEGRYGHGQMLWVQELLLLTAEGGEVVLLRPTPAGPAELHRFRVFGAKTWNPPALAGDWLLLRNDQEAAALRLARAVAAE